MPNLLYFGTKNVAICASFLGKFLDHEKYAGEFLWKNFMSAWREIFHLGGPEFMMFFSNIPIVG